MSEDTLSPMGSTARVRVFAGLCKPYGDEVLATEGRK